MSLERDLARLTTDQLYAMRTRYEAQPTPSQREREVLDAIARELRYRGRELA